MSTGATVSAPASILAGALTVHAGTSISGVGSGHPKSHHWL